MSDPPRGRIRSKPTVVGPSRVRGSSSPDKGRSLSPSPPPSRRVGSSQVEIHLPSRCSHWMTCVPTRQSLPLGSRCGPPSKTPFYVNHRVQFLNTPLIAYVEFT